MTLRHLSTILLSALAAAGCASAPPEVANAENLSVSFYGFRENEQSLVLINEDNPNLTALTSSSDRHTSIKSVPAATLRDLVDYATSEGFFEHAASMSSPSDVAGTEAKAMLVIEADDHPYAMVLAPGRPDANRAFTNIQLQLMEVFRDTPSMQVMKGGVDGSTFFEQEQQKLLRSRDEAMRRGDGR